MSGFLKRDKINTANPAGGVNPASSPNVSQYGWTSYDAGNVNQIIEYVNIVKKYAESAKDSADYIASKFTEIERFIDYIESIYNQIGPIFENIDTIYKDVTLKHTEVKNAHADVIAAEQLVLPAAEQALANATASGVSATAAKASEVAAAQSAKDAADTAEELRKGQVYRGTWNIEANTGYPPKPDTNSVWDITLNEGSLEYTFDGKRWFWGDRLLYLKDDDQFSQIESGSTVVSVNGKSGAVQLSATDVGALPISGGTLTGKLKVPTGFSVGESDILGVSSTLVRVGDAAIEKPLALNAKNWDVSVQTTSASHRIYHQGFKPTAAEVEALPITGGTLTGGLQMTGDHSFRMTDTSSTNLRFTLSQGTGYLQAGHSTDDANQKMILSGINGKGLTDFQVSMANNTNPKVRWGSTQHQIYHQGNKPTAADVGAVPASDGIAALSQGVTPVNDSWLKDSRDLTSGSMQSPVGSDRTEFIDWIQWGHNGGQKMRHTLWCPTDNQKPTELWFAHTDVTAGVTRNHWRIYHEGYKPTAFDIGALSLRDGGVVDGSVTVNNAIRVKLPTNGGFHISGGSTYAEIAPILPAETVPAWNSGLRYYGPSDWRVGASNRVYHQGFKPTATDVGALPISGGTMTGSIRLNHIQAQAAVSALKSAPIWLPQTNIGTVNSYIPFGHMSARAEAGYITHLNFGLYKRGVGSWDGSGMYIATGDNDGNPTEHFLFKYGGDISHSKGHTFYHTGNKPTASDIQVNNPKTKIDETLFEVIQSLRAELDTLKSELHETKEKLNEFILK